MLDLMELTTLTIISLGEMTYKDYFVLQTGEFKLHNKKQSDKIISLSVGAYSDSVLGQDVYLFNDDGPVYGPNGEWELDPDDNRCDSYYHGRPVFATCKNNCPGGEFTVVSSELFSNNYNHQQTNSMFLFS